MVASSVLEVSCNCLLLLVEISKTLLPFLNLVENALDIVEWISDSLGAFNELLEVVDDVGGLQPILLFHKGQQVGWLGLLPLLLAALEWRADSTDLASSRRCHCSCWSLGFLRGLELADLGSTIEIIEELELLLS